MPYTATRRFYNAFGKKISRYLTYRKAKKMSSEISRDIASLESRFLKSRLHNA